MKVKDYLSNYSFTNHIQIREFNKKPYMYDDSETNKKAIDEMEIRGIDTTLEHSDISVIDNSISIKPIIVLYVK